jgi:hypothetical protein
MGQEEDVFRQTGLIVGVRVMVMEHGAIQWEGTKAQYIGIATRIQVCMCVRCGAIRWEGAMTHYISFATGVRVGKRGETRLRSDCIHPHSQSCRSV